MLREARGEEKVFDLPSRRFWRGSPDVDLSVRVHGRRVASPVGPAAGPHGQLAQNILLSWLAGSRFVELKTVQVNDALTIPRPCIDMETVGYNVEWSQELRLAESLREYVKGSMLIDVARAESLLGRPDDPARDEAVLDLSVGYDLAGLRSPSVCGWIASMKDARAEVEAVRREIPGELGRLRDVDFRSALSDQVTLSTFHGCPAGEIEAMASFLMEELGLHVTVKLNPTLLGKQAVDGLLHDVLGYAEIETRPEDFAKDLDWERALELTDRLAERARALGREFRLKLSNTLVVRNHRRVFPEAEPVMYLSGAPLHVITMSLVERVRRARPRVPLSFSAGVDNRNFADCVAIGLAPVTVCSDLLKPGGYGRLPKYLDNLGERMRERGVARVGDYVVKACGTGEQAIDRVVADSRLRDALLTTIRSPQTDLLGVLVAAGQDALYDAIVGVAAELNTPVVAARVRDDPRYRAETQRPPRRIGRHLALFDCINCDKCLPACPNDANFTYEIATVVASCDDYLVEGGGVRVVPGAPLELRERHQIATFQDFCNDCGNCDTFCPEEGGPYLEKPRFFGSLEAWRRHAGLDGFHVAVDERGAVMSGRIRGVEYRLENDAARGVVVVTDGAVILELRTSDASVLAARAAPAAPEGHRLCGRDARLQLVLLEGVLDPRRANPVNA